MDALTRRRFLLASAAAGGAAAVAAGGIGLAELLATARHPGADPDDQADRLVVVTLYGGNDGLNTVVPYADPAYHSARPELAYDPEEVLRLDDALGLNPVLTGLKRLWDRQQVGIVLGVGYPRPDRSHFRSMDIWQTASPELPVATGWVGRWLDGTRASAETAVSFEPVLPPLLVGERQFGACVAINGLRLPPGVDAGMVAALGGTQDGESELQARAAQAYRDLLDVDSLVRQAEHGQAVTAPTDRPVATATGGAVSLAGQLALVARCVEAGVPTRVYSVSLGGFDTHAQERIGQEALLRQLDEALSSFVERLGRTSAGRRVSVVVYSEFGRRVRANASDGTDHGTAGPVFVLGPRVVGGLHGEHPSLTDLDAGDLKATTDFRDVFGALLGTVLGAEPARYLAGYQPKPLSLIRTAT
ncbi:DUF1501 domain-containing protein [Micromonospora sp. DT31]|uniref:DUF1501 domain-containing protein n=1 Tax=Micromonospora sp. DT31 TaxID=3393434 RepID=UPI003CF0F293